MKKRKKNLYLIDGDNNFKEATARLGIADDTDDVRIFVSQEGLYNKLRKQNKPHCSVTYVPRKTAGDQAVDNRIKSILGNAMKEEYERVYVISRDNGYDELVEKMRDKYKRDEKHVAVRYKF